MTEESKHESISQWLHDNQNFTNQFVLEWLRTHPSLLRCGPISRLHLSPPDPFPKQSPTFSTPAPARDREFVCPEVAGERTVESEQYHYRRRNAAELCQLKKSEVFMELVKDITSPEFSTTRLAQRIIEDCMILLKAERASIYLTDGGVLVSSRLLDMVEGSLEGTSRENRPEDNIVLMGSGIVGETAQSGAAINIPDAQKVCAMRTILLLASYVE